MQHICQKKCAKFLQQRNSYRPLKNDRKKEVKENFQKKSIGPLFFSMYWITNRTDSISVRDLLPGAWYPKLHLCTWSLYSALLRTSLRMHIEAEYGKGFIDI